MLNYEKIKQMRKEVNEIIISLPAGSVKRMCYEIYRKALNDVLEEGEEGEKEKKWKENITQFGFQHYKENVLE